MSFFKAVSIVLIGATLSFTGEKKALQCDALPRLPDTRELNPRVLSARMVAASLFGGIRGIIVDLAWMRIDHLWHHARFYRLPSLYEFVTTVQPEYIEGWVLGGWHMAYNMSLEAPQAAKVSEQIKKKVEMEWAFRGIRFLKAGAAYNPESAKLPFEIGWTYYHRLKDYRSAIPWFEKSASLPGATDVTSRLIPHAYEKLGDRETAYKKWLALKSHPSYNRRVPKKIIDRNIRRLKNILEK